MKATTVMRRGTALLTGLILAAFLGGGCGPSSGSHVHWLLYGDSLSQQSAPYLSQHGTVGNRYYGGSAPCNWLRNLKNDRTNFTPDKVLVQFIGNTPACLNGRDPQSAYEHDLVQLVNFWQAQGVPVTMIISPPTPTDTLAWARQAELTVAANRLMPVNDAGKAVLSATGQFTFLLPCQASETRALGCGAEQPGQIRVRDADGIHFPKTPYSSGAERFAAAEAGS
ncbi:MAG TPA: hypothetical protein VLV81_13500 [Acidimicrobiia bacterium]|nr:hypothetical protein [Acidimicrobiia bacterium]